MLARGFCHWDQSLPRWQLYDLGKSWQRSSGCCRTSPGPGLGIKAASSPGGAMRQEHHHPVWRRGQVDPSKSCRISFFKSVNFCAINIFPFPFWIQNLVQVGAAAKSLQLCPTLCDPIDDSPPGSPFPGILQARTLEWVAISFSNA